VDIIVHYDETLFWISADRLTPIRMSLPDSTRSAIPGGTPDIRMLLLWELTAKISEK